MLVLVFLFVIFFWLVVGALQYLACVASPRLRRYALSAALWWVVWGPCSLAWMMLAGLAMVARAFAIKDHDFSRLHASHLPEGLGWGYLILGMLGTAACATVIAWLHQMFVRRLTFSLFRLYTTAVSGGVGSVFGWCFGWWILSEDMRYGWILGSAGMLAFVTVFGVAAYKNSRALRGEAPTKMTWLSVEEFEGA